MRSSIPKRPSFRPKIGGRPSINKKKVQKHEHYGSNWEELSEYVRKRDNYTCQVNKLTLKWKCSLKFPPPFHGLLHAHHIVERNRGGADHPSNLLTVCKECHGKLHGKNLGTISDKQRNIGRK